MNLNDWWNPQQTSSPSLAEANGTIIVPVKESFRKFMAFLGPGYLVAVGYMDPGNWATSIAGGSQFGYALLSVVLISNIMAILLQALCARLGLATRRDLAQACRDAFPKPVAWVLWFFAEIAIIATDLAEVIGTAIALNLLFKIPLEMGVIITALDVFIILLLQNFGFRYIEAFVAALLFVIFSCFGVQIFMADPEWSAVIKGFAPTTDLLKNSNMLYLALGIIGATVMPHNLYLHSSIVQTRRVGDSIVEKKSAIKFATIDSTVALMLALLINSSILIVAAAAFYTHQRHDIVEIGQAYELLTPLLGYSLAPTLFAVALLCCGINSTVTATLAGQIVMEGFINIRLKPWLRRVLTRMLAIIPAVIVTMFYGAKGTAELLVLSQVVLSFQLPFAIIPLIMFTSSRKKMGELTAPLWLTAICIVIAAIIICLNIKLLLSFFLLAK